MSEHNTIFDCAGKIIGQFRFGVAWRKEPRERLGEYDRNSIYSESGEIVASFKNNSVYAPDGGVLGQLKYIENDSKIYLIVNGKSVGMCIGLPEAAAAAITFLGQEMSEKCP